MEKVRIVAVIEKKHEKIMKKIPISLVLSL